MGPIGSSDTRGLTCKCSDRGGNSFVLKGKAHEEDFPSASLGLDVALDRLREGRGVRQRVILFTIGFALGVSLFLIGGITWQPTPPKCPGCAVLNSSIHNANCTEAVQGGWICEGP